MAEEAGLLNLVPIAAAFLSALILTPVGILLSRRTPLVDTPDGTTLKIHGRPVPNPGGLILAASLLPVVVLFAWHGREMRVIIIGAMASLGLGLIDDLKGLKPLTRLLAETALACGVAWGGLTAALFHSPVLDCALAALIVVSAINAVNLLDGMDGLASGVVAICCAAFAVFSYFKGDQPAFLLTSVALAAFVGFLPYNFHPASIFLGNSGSSLSGFLLAGLMILSLRAAPTPAGFAGSLLIVGLPAADTAFAILRRIRSGRRITVGDRDHFYDKLLRKGFSQKQSAVIGYTAAASFAALGLALLLAGA